LLPEKWRLEVDADCLTTLAAYFVEPMHKRNAPDVARPQRHGETVGPCAAATLLLGPQGVVALRDVIGD
jgi:hypothetical protein